MAQGAVPAANAIAANAVVAFIEYSEYNGYKIIVPKQFSSDDSNLLRELQVQAIDAGAVSKVKRDTMVNTAAWTTKGQPCVHVNFRPILRDNFDYSAFLPLSLVEKCGHVVAGVCVTSLDHCWQLNQRIKSLPLSLDDSLGSLLERLWLRLETNLNHNNRQNTSNRSSSTESATYQPRMSTTTKEVKGEESGTAKLSLTKRPRRGQLSNACNHCHRIKRKCEALFPCRNCKRCGIECIERKRKSKFRPITTSYSIPTTILNL